MAGMMELLTPGEENSHGTAFPPSAERRRVRLEGRARACHTLKTDVTIAGSFHTPLPLRNKRLMEVAGDGFHGSAMILLRKAAA